MSASNYSQQPLDSITEFTKPVNATKVVYFQDPITAITVAASKSASSDSSNSSLTSLEKRQMDIISALDDLSKKVQAAIDSKAQSSGQSTNTQVNSLQQLKSVGARGPSAKFSITVAATRPPLATLVLANKLAMSRVVDIRSFWHSSLDTPVLETDLAKQRVRPRGNCDFRLEVIYKKGAEASMVVQAGSGVSVEGDDNIARFICRQFDPAFYCTENPLKSTQIDYWIDIAAGLLGNAKSVKLAIKEINVALGKADKPFLMDDGLSLADIVLWSTFVTNSIPFSERNLKAWDAKIRELPFVVAALN